MKSIKKIIIFLVTIIFIIIVVLSIMLLRQKNDDNTSETISNITSDSGTNDIFLVKDESEYQDIKRIFNKYMTYINYLDYNQFQVKVDEDKQKQIKEEYLKKGKEFLEKIIIEDATKNKDWINKISELAGKKVDILEINKYVFNQINIYLLTIEYDKEYTDNMIFFVDEKNESFSILPNKIWKMISKENLKTIVNELNIKLIERNDYNEVKKIKLDEERICLQYYYDYMNMLRNDTDKLYETLNNEYREKRFENIENFKDYINENKQKLEKVVPSNYQVKSRNNYTEYRLVDEEGRNYIFCATAAMKYTMYLDTYTVDLPEFTEQYSNASDQRKVALNITKINSAINNQDYKYVYSKLADSFKNNYFENEDKLREYIINNLYKKSTLQLLDFAREGNYYTYKIRVIKEYEEGEEIPFGKNEPSKNVNIVMQLKEGTDFVMSFSIDE